VVKAPKPLKNKPFKFHSERIVADSTKPEDPELAKLDLALAAVKEDILSTNKQITDERKWVIAVAKIIASYNDKMKRVEAHIIALRKEMKSLYRKKKQIENLKLQRALEAKLKEARDELATLTGSLKHVQVKNGELIKSGADLRATIAGIQAQLAKLRGQQLRKPKAAAKGRKCGKGKRYSRKQKKCVSRKARKASRKSKAKKF
jgi:predicted  nucleic acid-binding Zn-ribbon protein